MAKKLVIKNGVVDNIIEADDGFTIEGCELVAYQEGADIGYAWDGTNVVIPAPAAPTAEQIRMQRDALLAETDWRFRSDLTPSQEWIDYCQALRDIPAQEGFPTNVTWPIKP